MVCGLRDIDHQARVHNVTSQLSFTLTLLFLSHSQPLSCLVLRTHQVAFNGQGLFQLCRHNTRSEPYEQHNHCRTKASRSRITYRLEPIIRYICLSLSLNSIVYCIRGDSLTPELRCLLLVFTCRLFLMEDYAEQRELWSFREAWKWRKLGTLS